MQLIALSVDKTVADEEAPLIHHLTTGDWLGKRDIEEILHWVGVGMWVGLPIVGGNCCDEDVFKIDGPQLAYDGMAEVGGARPGTGIVDGEAASIKGG